MTWIILTSERGYGVWVNCLQLPNTPTEVPTSSQENASGTQMYYVAGISGTRKSSTMNILNTQTPLLERGFRAQDLSRHIWAFLRRNTLSAAPYNVFKCSISPKIYDFWLTIQNYPVLPRLPWSEEYILLWRWPPAAAFRYYEVWAGSRSQPATSFTYRKDHNRK